jgi:hypothetical protein
LREELLAQLDELYKKELAIGPFRCPRHAKSEKGKIGSIFMPA